MRRLLASANFLLDAPHPNPRQGLQIDFPADVSASLTPTDLQLENLTKNTSVGLQSPTLTGNVATFRTSATSPVLDDGNYELHLPADRVSPALAADLYKEDFFLNGDFDRNRAVGFTDLVTLNRNFNKTNAKWSEGDMNLDGVVNFADLTELSRRYQIQLTASPRVAGELVSDALPMTTEGLTPIRSTWVPSFPSGVTIAGQTVFRSLDGVTYTQLATVDATATSYDDTTAEDGRKYWYRVRPFQTVTVAGVTSNQHFHTTLEDWAVSVMKAPTISKTSVGATGLFVSWINHSISAYEVELSIQRAGSTDDVRLTHFLSTQSSGFIDGLDAAADYIISIRAMNAHGTSIQSQPTAIRTEQAYDHNEPAGQQGIFGFNDSTAQGNYVFPDVSAQWSPQPPFFNLANESVSLQLSNLPKHTFVKARFWARSQWTQNAGPIGDIKLSFNGDEFNITPYWDGSLFQDVWFFDAEFAPHMSRDVSVVIEGSNFPTNGSRTWALEAVNVDTFLPEVRVRFPGPSTIEEDGDRLETDVLVERTSAGASTLGLPLPVRIIDAPSVVGWDEQAKLGVDISLDKPTVTIGAMQSSESTAVRVIDDEINEQEEYIRLLPAPSALYKVVEDPAAGNVSQALKIVGTRVSVAHIDRLLDYPAWPDGANRPEPGDPIVEPNANRIYGFRVFFEIRIRGEGVSRAGATQIMNTSTRVTDSLTGEVVSGAEEVFPMIWPLANEPVPNPPSLEQLVSVDTGGEFLFDGGWLLPPQTMSPSLVDHEAGMAYWLDMHTFLVKVLHPAGPIDDDPATELRTLLVDRSKSVRTKFYDTGIADLSVTEPLLPKLKFRGTSEWSYSWDNLHAKGTPNATDPMRHYAVEFGERRRGRFIVNGINDARLNWLNSEV